MEVRCVSCDRPLIQDLHTAFSLVIVGHEDDLARLNQDEDGVVADGKWVHLMDIIEDPILLAVPMAPRHPDCSDGTIIRGAAAANASAEEGSESEGRITDFTRRASQRRVRGDAEFREFTSINGEWQKG